MRLIDEACNNRPSACRGRGEVSENIQRAKRDLDFSTHSRQCVGRTSIHFFDLAFIQPPGIRRQGKTSAWCPSSSMHGKLKIAVERRGKMGRHINLLWAPGVASNLI